MQQGWTRRRFLTRTGAGLAAFGLVGTACSDDDGADTATPIPSTTTTSAPSALPDNDEAALTALFDPFFEPLGERVTRIGLYDLSQGFVLDDEGTHMAIYVEPIDPDGEGWDTQRYVDTIAPGMAACTPFIFETWSGMQSMDICQEPPQTEAPEPEPPIVTQVQLGRADSAFIDWDAVSLAELIAAAMRSPMTARVRGDAAIQENTTFVAAQDAATELV